MARGTRALGLALGVFATVGLTLGLAGLATTAWARTQFVTAAGGSDPGQLGPVFVALVFFQTTVTLLFAGVVLSALVGAMVGSRFHTPRRAAVVAGGSGWLGFYVMALVGVLVLSLAGGRATGQTYSLGQAVLPVLLAGVPAALAGTAGGALGARLIR